MAIGTIELEDEKKGKSLGFLSNRTDRKQEILEAKFYLAGGVIC